MEIGSSNFPSLCAPCGHTRTRKVCVCARTHALTHSFSLVLRPPPYNSWMSPPVAGSRFFLCSSSSLAAGAANLNHHFAPLAQYHNLPPDFQQLVWSGHFPSSDSPVRNLLQLKTPHTQKISPSSSLRSTPPVCFLCARIP